MVSSVHYILFVIQLWVNHSSIYRDLIDSAHPDLNWKYTCISHIDSISQRSYTCSLFFAACSASSQSISIVVRTSVTVIFQFFLGRSSLFPFTICWWPIQGLFRNSIVILPCSTLHNPDTAFQILSRPAFGSRRPCWISRHIIASSLVTIHTSGDVAEPIFNRIAVI